jgi:hypothetical protein
MEPTPTQESPPIDTLSVIQEITKIITDYAEKVIQDAEINSIVTDDSLNPE